MNHHGMFDSIAPIDGRYWDEAFAQYLSDAAFLKYKLRVELALVQALAARGMCPESVVQEVAQAIQKVTPEMVAEEEYKVRHDVRAMVNVLRRHVSNETKPYVHLTATSYDIIDSANALRYRDAVMKALVPALKDLMRALIILTEREADTVQVGRTHGQHAVPITFGYAMAGYVSRVGQSLFALQTLAGELKGKFSGAVGAHNATTLLFDDPQAFEVEVLVELGLTPVEHATQVAQPEPLTRLLAEIGIATGIMANLADDMRHLQRSEIAEVGEEFGESQVGSSTMPHKRNPVSFENVKSLWKVVVPRLMTVFMDQVSEHQRDLTNSASGRANGEIIAYATVAANRLAGAMAKLKVNRSKLEHNLLMGRGMIAAEPLYVLLAFYGHPDAHEAVRTLTLTAEAEKVTLYDALVRDPGLAHYVERFTEAQIELVKRPTRYIGASADKARAIAARWKSVLGL